MKQAVFEKFHHLYTERSNRLSPLDMGEDSVRYDFFLALMEVYKLKPSDLWLEYPIHSSMYTAKIVENRKRKEKPLIDLMVKTKELNITGEFGLFRQNSNPEGNINKTNRIFKLVGDMVRLGLHCHFTNCESYFICVADDKLRGHRLRSGLLLAFPAERYEIDHALVQQLIASTSIELSDRFFSKAAELRVAAHAEKIFEKRVESRQNDFNSTTLIWKVNAVPYE